MNQKARLVARGFLKNEGFDYTEVFSPIAKHDTIRLVIVSTGKPVEPRFHYLRDHMNKCKICES